MQVGLDSYSAPSLESWVPSPQVLELRLEEAGSSSAAGVAVAAVERAEGNAETVVAEGFLTAQTAAQVLVEPQDLP